MKSMEKFRKSKITLVIIAVVTVNFFTVEVFAYAHQSANVSTQVCGTFCYIRTCSVDVSGNLRVIYDP